VNIKTKLKFENILFGCLKQVGCLIEVIADPGLAIKQNIPGGNQCIEPVQPVCAWSP